MNNTNVGRKRDWKRHMYTMLSAVLFTTAIWKQPKRPEIDEGIKKTCCTRTVNFHSAIATKEILPPATTRRDVKGITLRDISQAETITI